MLGVDEEIKRQSVSSCIHARTNSREGAVTRGVRVVRVCFYVRALVSGSKCDDMPVLECVRPCEHACAYAHARALGIVGDECHTLLLRQRPPVQRPVALCFWLIRIPPYIYYIGLNLEPRIFATLVG